MGVDDDRGFMVGEDLGVGEAVVDDATIGFVADQEYFRAELGPFSAQQLSKGLDPVKAVQGPRGVVGELMSTARVRGLSSPSSAARSG